MSSRRIQFLIEAVNRTKVPFGEVENGLERLRRARLDSSRVVMEEYRAQSYLNRVYRIQHRTFFDTIGLLRNIGYAGRGVLQMYQTYTLSQMRMKATTDDLADAEARLQELREKGLEDTVYFEAAEENYRKIADELERLKSEELMANIGYIMTGAGVTAQIVNTVANLAMKYQAVATALGAVGTAATAAGPGIALVLGLGGLELAAPPGTPSPMSELAGPGALTKEEMLAGMTYEEKFAAWREDALMGLATQTGVLGKGAVPQVAPGPSITINQTVYGVDANDAANKTIEGIKREIADRVTR